MKNDRGLLLNVAKFWYSIWLMMFVNIMKVSVDKKNQLDVSYEPIHGRTTYQPDLTTFLQPRHIPTRGYNITQ